MNKNKFDKEVYEPTPPPDILERPVKNEGKEKSSKEIEEEFERNPVAEPGSHGEVYVWTKKGTWLDEKSFDKIYVNEYDYGYTSYMENDKRVSIDFKSKLKGTNIEERLELLYRRFKQLFETNYYTDSTKNELLKTIKTNTYRIKLMNKLPILSIYSFIGDEVIENLIPYHKQFTVLKNIEHNVEEHFRDYVNKLEKQKLITNDKARKMKKDINGFITCKDSVIIWNKFNEGKFIKVHIVKLLFANKE